ncbi:iron ABC transporter permease [Lipingzhangella sp. LS1_29]|uniref:Iron ABC transporter permease n=1 Tax=Lipingzhangella rawalii TaxID=2055835 RepID=A0ABU2H5N5_9ACTN|nr:iron ABC transporter permease [Lipingzhangella rawalii]MDS1270317.1 iron ABC transporter permease [Lipingzhangella rawalii]
MTHTVDGGVGMHQAAPPLPRPRARMPVPARLGALSAATASLLALALVLGSTPIPLVEVGHALFGTGPVSAQTHTIVWEVRLPRAVTALAAGSALGLAGLQMQTLLRNPLAEPYILGVSSGASLGVAIVVLASGSGSAAFTAGLAGGGRAGTVLAAAMGAASVLALMLLLARWTQSVATLLIIGVMVGSGVSALVSVLVASADPRQVQQFVMWGMGSFSGPTWPDLAWLLPILGVGSLASLALVKPLNAMLLGDTYARTMGVNVRVVRWLVLFVASGLAGTVTAFCGPVAFLGLAIPHLTRIALTTADHRILMPACVVMGGAVALLCGTVASLPGTAAVLPLNSVTALVGAPIVITVLLRGRANTHGGAL